MDAEEDVIKLLKGTATAMGGIMRERLGPEIREALRPFVSADKLEEATATVLVVVLPPMDFDSAELYGD